MDTWALGVMLYELLMAVTPFHSYEMKELMAKINDGRYTLSLREPYTVECCLFLTQCLQTNEDNRISVNELIEHPFIQTGEATYENLHLSKLDLKKYQADMDALYGPN